MLPKHYPSSPASVNTRHHPLRVIYLWRVLAVLGHPALHGTSTSLCNGRSRASCPSRHQHIPVQWPLSGILPFAAPAHPCAMAVLGHPALSSNKKSHRRGGFCYWWRRRESNPRPQVLRLWLYMLILSINLVDGYPTGRENQRRAWISFNESTPGVLHRDPI